MNKKLFYLLILSFSIYLTACTGPSAPSSSDAPVALASDTMIPVTTTSTPLLDPTDTPTVELEPPPTSTSTEAAPKLSENS